MIRVIGAVLIVAATSAIGVRGIVKLRGHVRSLESIIASLRCYGGRDMFAPDTNARGAGDAIKGFASPMQKIVCKCVRRDEADR